MRLLIRRILRHVNLVATVFLVLMGTSFAIAQESGDPSGQQAEETADPSDGGQDDPNQGDSSDGGSNGGDGGDRGSDGGGSDEGDGDGDGDDSDQAEGQPGLLGITVREGAEVKTDLYYPKEAAARCAEGEVLTGGGVRTADLAGGAKPIVQSSHPNPEDPNQWQATVLNSTGNGSLTATAYAVCAAQSP